MESLESGLFSLSSTPPVPSGATVPSTQEYPGKQDHHHWKENLTATAAALVMAAMGEITRRPVEGIDCAIQ